MKTLLREPLLHFFLIGAALFWLYGVLQTGTAPKDDTIIITTGQIKSLRDNFERVWSRPASEEELAGLVQDYIWEEILYRDALALGLDQNDIVIRRRLRQKMEFLSEEILQKYTPSDQELQTFFKQNQNLYDIEPSFTFTQVYLNPEKHGKALEEEIQKLLTQLKEGKTSELGDPILIDQEYEQSPYSEVVGLFGKPFADELQELPKGVWKGPIHSGYGVHVVQLQDKQASVYEEHYSHE